jgi:hypothetical protein
MIDFTQEEEEEVEKTKPPIENEVDLGIGEESQDLGIREEAQELTEEVVQKMKEKLAQELLKIHCNEDTKET